jgi:hypothetical protein|tara:strand:+ start:950 stop:1114 length:165 start_codon:yes stop_codon:yes gene_type:complete
MITKVGYSIDEGNKTKVGYSIGQKDHVQDMGDLILEYEAELEEKLRLEDELIKE